MRTNHSVMDELELWNKLPKIRQWYTRARRSLIGKLIFFFCLIILPVNILMIIITSFVTSAYEQRITDAYQYQLGIYTQAIRNQIDSMEQDMNDFLSIDNLVVLVQGSHSDSMLDMIRFNSNLEQQDIWSVYPGMFYVWDRRTDILSFTNAGKTYPIDLRSSLETVIRQDMEEKEVEKQHINQRILVCEDWAFLLEEYDYPFFSIGILYDVEAILNGFFAEMEIASGSIYLTDSDGNLIAGVTEQGYLCREEMGNTEEWKEHKLLVVSQDLNFGDTSLVYRILRSDYMKGLNLMLGILYAFCIISFAAIPILCLVEKRLVVDPVKDLCIAMEEVEGGNLEYQIEGKTGSYQMDFLYYSFNHMIEELHHMVIESYEKEIQNLQTDSINMRLQVNQHMLLNFLNTIYSLSCAGKKEEVEEFTLLLMNYFRYVLRQNIGLVTVAEEMQFVQDYLKLQRIRFPQSFHLVYMIEDGAENLLLPQLLIQNFVENTIKYGLILGKEIEIIINVRTEEEYLIVSVCDTGNGMPEERAAMLQRGEPVEDQTGKHIGIWNCKRRLKYYYGEQQEMTVTSSPGQGTQIWMKMRKEPLHREEAAVHIRQMKQEKRQGDVPL